MIEAAPERENDPEPSKFAVDCYNLWYAGYAVLPTVASAYAAGSQYLSYSYERCDESQAWSNSRSLGCSKAFKDWTDLRDLTQTILGRTAQNLYTVGEVLMGAAAGFAEADTTHSNELGSAAEQLESQIEDYQDEVKKDHADADRDDLLEPPYIPMNPDIPDSEIADELIPEES